MTKGQNEAQGVAGDAFCEIADAELEDATLSDQEIRAEDLIAMIAEINSQFRLRALRVVIDRISINGVGLLVLPLKKSMTTPA